MGVYCVTYDLKTPSANYGPLFEEIKKCPGWWHYLESTWLVATGEDANQLANRLMSVIDSGDRLLVISVGRDFQGWLPKDAWDWINQHISMSLAGMI